MTNQLAKAILHKSFLDKQGDKMLTDEQKATMVRPGDEPIYMKAHGFIYRTTFSYVDVMGGGPVIRVVPCVCAGLSVSDIPKELIWADLWWDGYVYFCRLFNTHEPGWHLDFRTSSYGKLSDALRHARRMVAKTAPVPPYDWQPVMVKPLTSPYPTDRQYRETLADQALIDFGLRIDWGNL